MRRKKRRPTGRYRIGYCKPPKRTQFKRGTSGNPKGRKKGSRNRVNEHLAMDELVRIMKIRAITGRGEAEGGESDFDHGMAGADGRLGTTTIRAVFAPVRPH